MIQSKNDSHHQKFLWGAATSSYQTAGGITNNDWHHFTTAEPIKKRISKLTAASIFYKDIRQLQLQPAGIAVRFWEKEYYSKPGKDLERIIQLYILQRDKADVL